MEILSFDPDVCSVLTHISANESPKSTPRSICLHTDERFTGFDRNDDPNIAKYMETKMERKGWEKYRYLCGNFGIPPLQVVKECLIGERNFNLAYYIPKSIGVVYAFEILNEQTDITLTSIDMRDCPMTETGSSIDMRDCPMTETGCISLNELLRRRSPIEYLNLQNNRIGHKGVEILEQGLYVNQGIKYINLSGCNLGDEGAVILARALNSNALCEHLDISHNNLYTGSGEAIKTILSNTHIQVLNLEWNELYMGKCVQKIFQGVKSSGFLKEINYSWNGLSGTDWIKSFKQALIKNETLEVLRMENNRLTGVADQIMPGISKSQSLKEVYIGANPWTEKDYMSIINPYQKPSNLNVLGLGNHTYLTADCVKLITRAKNQNPQINIIYRGQIKDQPLPEVDFKRILVDRMSALALKPKKKRLRKNMGHFFLKLKEDNLEYDDPENFIKTITGFGAKLDNQLIQQFVDEFSNEIVIKNKKVRKIALHEIADYYLSRHPTEPLPIKKVKTQKKKKKKVKKDGNGGKK